MAIDVVTLAVAKSASKTYTNTAVAAIGNGFSYKESVATIADLPASATKGDEYTVTATGGAYVYTGSAWASVGIKGEKGDKGDTGGSTVSVSATGTSTDKVKYITIDGTESKMAIDVVNNVTSTSTEDALSANMGKELQAQISNLENMGRFLAIWNCATGLPTSNPTTLPYSYRTGDYYRVGTVAKYTHSLAVSGTENGGQEFSVSFSFKDETGTAYSTIATLSAALYAAGHNQHSGTCSATGTCGTYTIAFVASDDGEDLLLQTDTTEAVGVVLNAATGITLTDTVSGSLTNYKPNGSSYTGAASVTVESESVEIGWVYYYDGTQWLAQSAGGGGLVQDVQVNGTSVLDAGTGVANIPVASSSALGVVKTATAYGTNVNANNILYIEAASDAEISSKGSYCKPVVPAHLDSAIKAGLGSYNGTAFTDAEKTTARNTIGAVALEEYDSTASSYDTDVLYFVIDD